MPSITVDNSAPHYVFDDSSRLSDGVASFAQALIQAPQQAAAIRRQRQADQLAERFRQSQMDRGDRAQQLQEQWHQEANQQHEQDKALQYDLAAAHEGAYQGDDEQMAALSAKIAQAMQAKQEREAAESGMRVEGGKAHTSHLATEDFNTRARLVGDTIMGVKKLFSPAAKTNAGTGWHSDGFGGYFRTGMDGALEFYDPKTDQIRKAGAPAGGGAPPAPASPAAPAAPPGPGTASTGFRDPRTTVGLLGFGADNVPSDSEWNASQDRTLAASPPPAPGIDPNPVNAFRQLSGLDPAPEFLPHLLGRDDNARAQALRAMPPGERLQAIAALKKMGYR